MGKIHPLTAADHESSDWSSSFTPYITSKTETFTIWMKSLVMQTHGCTVFNENGEVVYRIDNYDKKGSYEVYLMDLKGRVLFTILRKKLSLFRKWKGYKCDGLKDRNQKPFFQVRKAHGILEGDNSSYEITIGPGNAKHSCLRLESSGGKSAFRIVNSNGRLVAEAKRKQSTSGVLFGDDVLTLAVEPHVDHSFIMALVTVHGLIKHKL